MDGVVGGCLSQTTQIPRSPDGDKKTNAMKIRLIKEEDKYNHKHVDEILPRDQLTGESSNNCSLYLLA